MPVVDSSRGQRSWELVDVELWIVPGFGHRPDVGHEVDAEALQQPDELLDRAGGMTDGVNGRRVLPPRCSLLSGSADRGTGVSPSDQIRTGPNTSSRIGAVTPPVEVFCWLR
jgi:hypothetical protein